MYKIFDLHNDYFLKMSSRRAVKYLNKSLKNSNEIVSAVWTSELNFIESMQAIENASKFVNSHNGIKLGVEDLHFLNEKNLDNFINFRPSYAGLTWNTANALAGGAHESGRLTSFGKKVVKKLEENYIQVDLAHLNEQSFMDVAKITEKPLFCSHTAFYSIQACERNLKDYQLKMIVDSGGLVGLCLVSMFIAGNRHCKLDDLVSHIDYFACKFGIDNLAIGTDFYGTKQLPQTIKNYNDLTSKLALKLENIGYTQKSINKIFYENASQFFS
ncbi:MAG: membrane dipeptidase [Clostridia bacterium]|nr:membrane dipeptidase [Clostridia bacterium]